jgi:hypothetical protein
VDIEKIRNNLKSGYDILAFEGKYHADREQFSKAFGKQFSLTLDPHNALRLWEESHEIIFHKIAESARLDNQEELLKETKDFLYRFDFNVDSILDLWVAINIITGFCAFDTDYNPNDYVELIMKKGNDVTSIRFSSKERYDEITNAVKGPIEDSPIERKKLN